VAAVCDVIVVSNATFPRAFPVDTDPRVFSGHGVKLFGHFLCERGSIGILAPVGFIEVAQIVRPHVVQVCARPWSAILAKA